MIVFDLACAGGHGFEAWFGSHDDYDGQQGRGLVSCPMCGDPTVDKAPMAPRISTGISKDRPKLPIASTDTTAMMKAAMAAQTKMLAASEDVGTRFAEEARAIHDGESDARLIHGQASITDARKLLEDGIAVAPLPFPIRDPARDN